MFQATQNKNIPQISNLYKLRSVTQKLSYKRHSHKSQYYNIYNIWRFIINTCICHIKEPLHEKVDRLVKKIGHQNLPKFVIVTYFIDTFTSLSQTA